MSLWRSAFPVLQKAIPAHRSRKILKALDRAATVYHSLYENSNCDSIHNGEGMLLEKLHKSGNLDLVFDVGANVGEYSQLARRISPGCRIFAFEPVSATFRKLTGAHIGGEIELVNAALGDTDGPMEILVPADSTIVSLLGETQQTARLEARPETISVARGETFLSGRPDISSISLLKVDTEGFEPRVLKGFGSKLQCASVVQFEYGKANLFAKYFLHDFFADYGNAFSIGKIFPKGVEFYDEYNWDLDDLIGPNYVMVRKDRGDILSLLRL